MKAGIAEMEKALHHDAEKMDALAELSNIGMGHAATALSQLISRRISVTVPRTSIVDFGGTAPLVASDGGVVVAVSLQILGDARGTFLLILPMESAVKMLDLLLPAKGGRGQLFNDMELSSLKEVGNILASSFLNALGTFLKISLIPSIPKLSFHEAGKIVSHVLADLGVADELSVLAETEFSGDGGRIHGHLFLIPEPESLKRVLSAIGVGKQ